MYDVFFHLKRFLQEFLYPFDLALILLCLVAWLLWRQRIRSAKVLVALCLLLLYLPSTGIVVGLLLGPLEGVHPSRPVGEYPPCDAIVVLGGATISAMPPRYEASQANDRLIHAARLYRLGKAECVVLSGNGAAGTGYIGPDGGRRTEIDDMRDILAIMGVPDSAILLENDSRDTFENAQNTVRLLRERGLRSILLVTSAFHMRRACALFEASRQSEGVDIEVIPAPSDHTVGGVSWNWRSFLPDPRNIAKTSMALKEYAGFLVYRLLGKA